MQKIIAIVFLFIAWSCSSQTILTNTNRVEVKNKRMDYNENTFTNFPTGSTIINNPTTTTIQGKVEGYNQVINSAGAGVNYPAFPYADVIGDIVLFAWKSSTTHAGSGALMLGRSRDGNNSIDSIWQLNVSGTKVCSNLAFGTIKTGSHAGRVCIKWRDAAVSDVIEFSAYSDDTMKTWIAGTTQTYNITSSVFGRIKQISGDTITAWRYSVGTSDTSFLNYSIDGATWTAFDTVAMNATQKYDEADLQYLGNGQVIAVVRSEAPLNRPSQFSSTDNGHTWIRRGGLNLLNFATNNTPTFVELYGNKLWLLSNFRDGAGANSVWWYSNGITSQVFTDTSKWAKRSAYYHPLNDDLDNATLGINNGYTVPFQVGGKLIVVGYDNDPAQTVSVTAKTRCFTIPIIGNGDFAKVYNRINQSILTDSATLVSFPQIDLNDGLIYNTDSGFVIFNRDGWYSFKAIATFDTSSLGTYRQLYVYRTSNAYVSVAFDQPQVESQKTIGISIISDLNRMECGGVNLFRAGERLKVFAKQDTGGALNLINTIPNKRATLIIKRLND